MAKQPISTWTFVLAVVKWGRHVLMVQETKDGRRWSIPGGRVELGESLEEALRREVFEEAGVLIELEGVLKVEHTPIAAGDARLRVVYLARPAGETAPKTTQDEHSLGARWFTRGELATLPLRSPDALGFIDQALNGVVAPKALLGQEDASR
jgi:phosphatase NudJ